MPGRIIFAKVWGSRSHNCHTDNSDWDYAGVYICPTSQILSLHPPEDTKKHDSPEKKEDNPDRQFHEVGKFCSLLIKGNPAILEMLFTDRMCLESEEWLRLKKIRDRFLSAEAVHQYLGYMEGQLKRLIKEQPLHSKGGTYNEKWFYHCMRLMSDAKRIAQRQAPEIWKEGAERAFLLDIRHYKYSKEDAIKFIGDAILEVEALKPYGIPQLGDEEALNDWLLTLRKENWQ